MILHEKRYLIKAMKRNIKYLFDLFFTWLLRELLLFRSPQSFHHSSFVKEVENDQRNNRSQQQIKYTDARILKDATFQQCLFNTIFYFVIQVPIMLILALILAQLLNSPDIKGKGIYRTMIFLPCATSLVSYSMIFKSLFANDGLVNRVLSTVGIPTVDWFQNAWAARWVIVIALIWRWTGYNMVFYLAGLQNIDYSIYEAARIDGASPIQQFIHLTIPLLKPTILLTAIMSTSGTLQLFDESVNLTAGGPGKATMTLTHYIYNISFVETPKFNYAAALSVFILVVVAVLSAIQMKVGDKRD